MKIVGPKKTHKEIVQDRTKGNKQRWFVGLEGAERGLPRRRKMPNNAVVAATDGGSPGSGGGLKKGPWTAAEDAILMEYVKKHGEGNWNAVQKNSGLSRCGKSCRLRWANHLRPNLKKGSFSPDEERLILELHAKLGNKWARMAAQVSLLLLCFLYFFSVIFNFVSDLSQFLICYSIPICSIFLIFCSSFFL